MSRGQVRQAPRPLPLPRCSRCPRPLAAAAAATGLLAAAAATPRRRQREAATELQRRRAQTGRRLLLPLPPPPGRPAPRPPSVHPSPPWMQPRASSRQSCCLTGSAKRAAQQLSLLPAHVLLMTLRRVSRATRSWRRQQAAAHVRAPRYRLTPEIGGQRNGCQRGQDARGDGAMGLLPGGRRYTPPTAVLVLYNHLVWCAH